MIQFSFAVHELHRHKGAESKTTFGMRRLRSYEVQKSTAAITSVMLLNFKKCRAGVILFNIVTVDSSLAQNVKSWKLFKKHEFISVSFRRPTVR